MISVGLIDVLHTKKSILSCGGAYALVRTHITVMTMDDGTNDETMRERLP